MTQTLKPGDRVYWWWDTGIHAEQVTATVIRVNRESVTVKPDYGDKPIRVTFLLRLIDWPE